LEANAGHRHPSHELGGRGLIFCTILDAYTSIVDG